MRILFLDDDSARHGLMQPVLADHEAWYAYDADRAIKLLDGERFDLVLLDHDLGLQAGNSGQTVVDHIVAMSTERRPKRAVVHSWNHDAAMRMANSLYRCDVWVKRKVFGPEMIEMVKALMSWGADEKP
jgi:CheY-like chemotaxis protein